MLGTYRILPSVVVQSHVMAYLLQKHCRINVLAVKALLIIAFLVQARYPLKPLATGCMHLPRSCYKPTWLYPLSFGEKVNSRLSIYRTLGKSPETLLR